jgi:ferredoxin
MPWIDEEMCTGCETCIDECFVGAISMCGRAASINDRKCIRCGVCHDVCPNEAVRHDSELIPREVEANVSYVKHLLGHAYYANDKKKQTGLIRRMERYYTKNRRVAEQTIERLKVLVNEVPVCRAE